jgi:hypothetical protein
MRSILVAVSMALALAACSNDDAPTTPTAAPANSFVVNGSGYTEARFTADAGDAGSIAGGADGKGAVTMSGATTRSGERFTLTMVTKSSAVGSYQIGMTSGSGMTMLVSNGPATSSYLATSGSITISEWGVGGRVKGTFSGSFVLSTNPGATALQVTAGTFDAKLVD